LISHAQLLDIIERAGEDEARAAVTAYWCEASLATFVKNAWPFFHEDEPLIWGWYIDCICEHLEAAFAEEILWLLINVPPGFAKSLLCSVLFPAWCWLKKPWYRFLCLSTNDFVALRDARRHRDLVASPWYQNTFRPDWQLSTHVAADSNFATTRRGGRVSRTVRSGIIGARPHCRVLDDANDPLKVSVEENAKINTWLESVLLKRRARLTSPFVEIQQRTHESDATGYLLSRAENPNLVHLFLPNRHEPDRTFCSSVRCLATGELWTDQRTEPEELLNPAILDEATTSAERENDPATDEAQNQQNPTPEHGVIFLRDMFARWSHEPTIDDWRRAVRIPDFANGDFPTYPLPPKYEYLIITADPNNLKESKATRHTDYAVFDVWGKLGRDCYLVQQVRQKINSASSIQVLVQLVQQHGDQLACILIEKAANGPSIIAGLRAVLNVAAEEKLPREHQFVRDWSVQGETKRQRAEAISYVPASGRVYIQSEHENGEQHYWLAEVCGFPNRTRDDRVDTMTMALTFFERGRQFG